MNRTAAELEERKAQVAEQMRAIAHMCGAIAHVYDETRKFIPDVLVEQSGTSTARLMEYLGDVMNGMDIVQPEDEWTEPIFRKAHELWPQQPVAALSREPSVQPNGEVVIWLMWANGVSSFQRACHSRDEALAFLAEAIFGSVEDAKSPHHAEEMTRYAEDFDNDDQWSADGQWDIQFEDGSVGAIHVTVPLYTQPSGAQPVAWMYDVARDGLNDCTNSERVMKSWPDKRKIVPLYAAPAPSALGEERSPLEKLVSEYLSAKTTAEREWHLGSTEANQRRLTAAFNALHAYMMERLTALPSRGSK